MQTEPLTVQQTATHYWVVQSGVVELAGAVTREAAESERELLKRLRRRSRRRTERRDPRSYDDRESYDGGPGPRHSSEA
jgi:hypothetical protein